MDSLKATSIISVIVMFVGVTVIAMTFKADVDRNFSATIDVEGDLNRTLVSVNNTLAQQIERDTNLTKPDQEALISDIRTLRPMLEALTNESSKDTKGAIIHRNLTIDNYNNIREIIGRMQSMDNKLNELFFEKVANASTTNIFKP